jgi:hypothetical protein
MYDGGDTTMSDPGSTETIEITSQRAEARGRNDWFTPKRVTVRSFRADGSLALSVESSRAPNDWPPIYMVLPLDDARRVHAALGRQIATLDAADAAA